MTHKYIVMTLDGEECIFVFPRQVDHDRMYEVLQAIRFGDRDWSRKLRDGEAVSAGFVTDGRCHGHSETLDLASRPKNDTALLAVNKVPTASAAVLRNDREADRARFSDPAFNRWLDEGISDAEHTVWDQIGDVCAAWHGWENCRLYTDRPADAFL